MPKAATLDPTKIVAQEREKFRRALVLKHSERLAALVKESQRRIERAEREHARILKTLRSIKAAQATD